MFLIAQAQPDLSPFLNSNNILMVLIGVGIMFALQKFFPKLAPQTPNPPAPTVPTTTTNPATPSPTPIWDMVKPLITQAVAFVVPLLFKTVTSNIETNFSIKSKAPPEK